MEEGQWYSELAETLMLAQRAPTEQAAIVIATRWVAPPDVTAVDVFWEAGALYPGRFRHLVVTEDMSIAELMAELARTLAQPDDFPHHPDQDDEEEPEDDDDEMFNVDWSVHQ